MIAKEHEQFEQRDRKADEWIAREHAKEIANSKVLKMKAIAKSKAKEEEKKVEAGVTFFLVQITGKPFLIMLAVNSEELGQTFHAI